MTFFQKTAGYEIGGDPLLGHALRESALDAHDGDLPHISMAYGFLLDNPECFADFASLGMDGEPIWPADMPAEPSIELIAAYYGRI